MNCMVNNSGLFRPALGLLRYLRNRTAMVGGVIAFGALCGVILERFDGEFAEEGERRQVDEGHQPHKQVGQTPDKFKRCDGAHHHHRAHADAVNDYERL